MIFIHITGHTPDRWQSKTLILSRNVDKKSLETEFSIAIYRQMAIENTISNDFYLRSSIVKSVFDCRLSGVGQRICMYFYCGVESYTLALSDIHEIVVGCCQNKLFVDL